MRKWWYDREERLDQYEDEMSARARRNRHRRAILGFFILLVGLGANMWADRTRAEESRQALVDSSKVVVIDSCNRDFRALAIDRALLIDARKAILDEVRRGDARREDVQRSLDFYDHELARRPLPDCRRAGDIITDNPGTAKKRQPPPKPLYPGSPEAKKLGA